MNGHRSDLTKKTLLPVSQHFVLPGHSLDDFGRSKIYIIDHNPSWKENPVANHFCQINHSVDNFKVLGIDQVQGDKIHREVKESLWIKKLKTYELLGLNTKMENKSILPYLYS
jgi:hypothetical protein